MLKVMLVDDEFMVINGLKQVFDWAGLGFEIIGTASNGEQAISLFDELKPDVIITDILMPKMNGLEMVNILKNKNAEAEIIVFSGHDEFNYAREAIEMGICDYILKPIEKSEFTKTLNKVKEKIMVKRNIRMEISNLQKQIEESMPVLRNEYLNGLINGNMESREEMTEKFRNLRLKLSFRPYYLIKMNIDREGGVLNQSKTEYIGFQKQVIKNISAEYIGSVNTFEIFEDFQSVFIIVEASSPEEIDIIEEKINDLIMHVEKSFGFAFSAGVSRLHDNYDIMPLALKECNLALECSFYEGMGKCITVDSIEPYSGIPLSFPKQKMDLLTLKVRLLQSEDAVQILNEIFLDLRSNKGIPIDYFFSVSMQILIDIYSSFLAGDLKNRMYGNIFSFDEMKKKNTVEELQNYVKGCILEIVQRAKREQSENKKQVMVNALDFIESNFDKNITLENVADSVYISKNYLCNMFRKEMKVNFTDYIAKKRIDKAKDYLRLRQYKTYEIANMVGYSDYNYFSQVFKKLTGVTPSDFKNNEE